MPFKIGPPLLAPAERCHNHRRQKAAFAHKGNSAFHPVERRVAPLSRDLAGVVLSHEHFGSHLDSSGKTVDEQMERQNFQHAGETLTEVLSSFFAAFRLYLSIHSQERLHRPKSVQRHQRVWKIFPSVAALKSQGILHRMQEEMEVVEEEEVEEVEEKEQEQNPDLQESSADAPI
ncbi:hypothetical protein PoB_006530400 [Plakobranchus ocellatus]|uniref:Uncharacterized protein n=1 Tax=Plakobranchus ocellatus TaxID=259542 RepID=A0AAV4D3P7_9GAST|nr:hypothetical protein PoB_006530400 [Plakobranchus ocellatus]